MPEKKPEILYKGSLANISHTERNNLEVIKYCKASGSCC